MDLFAISALLITFTAVLGWINERYLQLPTAIGVTIGGLITSLVLIGGTKLGLGGEHWATTVLTRINFDQLLMHGMLSFLLFAGALHINLNDLWVHRGPILTLATLGVLISTAIVGVSIFLLLGALGLHLPLVHALLFGALISPTDPVAVLAILKRAQTPKSLEVQISGESLFNDGVGVVVFTAILDLALGGHGVTAGTVALHFLREAGGGALFGLVLGFIAYRMLYAVDNYSVEVLVTLALVTGGYWLAQEISLSGPLAMVMAGLFIGNRGRRLAMSDTTRTHLDSFWLVVDEALNAVLFLLIGLEVLLIDLTPRFLAAGMLAVPVVLAARFLSVGAPIRLLRLRSAAIPYALRLMTWSALRGGIAIALALSLPASAQRGLILVMTYVVVVFSLLVQGPSVEPLARRAKQAMETG